MCQDGLIWHLVISLISVHLHCREMSHCLSGVETGEIIQEAVGHFHSTLTFKMKNDNTEQSFSLSLVICAQVYFKWPLLIQ